ncbi:MAG: hypothetical protein AB7K52_14980 [Phycisphaerales bacterium]
MNVRPPSRPAALFVMAGTALSFSTPARADALSWSNAAGGSAALATNWNPNLVPDAADTLTFNLVGTYTVTFPASIPTALSHTFKRGTVTLSITGAHDTSSFVRVGDLSPDLATAILSSGALNAGSGVSIGNSAGATGTLTIDNEPSFLSTTNAGSDIVIGNAGAGTLNVTDGALVRPADDVILGAAGTGDGTLSVSGAGGFPLPAPSSTLDLPNAGQDLTVGALGTGSFNVSNGGLVNVDELFVALNPGSTGLVTVAGTGGIVSSPATINVATSLHLGNNPAIGATAGSATLTVNSGGRVVVAGTTRVGDPQGVGAGTLTVNTGGTYTTTSFIGSDSGGFLNLLGGTFRVSGGSFQPRNGLYVLDSSVGSPIFFLEQDATASLSAPVAPFEALVVGRAGAGLFKVADATLSISSGDLVLGDLAGSDGQLQIEVGGTVSTPAARSVIIGDAGSGALDLHTGALMNSGAVHVGAQNSGSGTITVDGTAGAPSTWNITGSLNLGGTAALARGTGSLEIGPFGAVNVDAASPSTISVNVWGAGDSLTVRDGGLLFTDGELHVHDGATFTLDGGAVDAADIELRGNPGTYLLRGSIAGPLRLVGAVSTISLSGDLQLQPSISHPVQLTNSGQITVGSHTLTIGGEPSSFRDLNNCSIGIGGRIVADVPLKVGLGFTLSGRGTVDAPISNLGTINALGTGLTFTKMLTGLGQGITGTTIIFTGDGGFTGSGAFSPSTSVMMNSGSTIIATGPLSMGNGASTGGFQGNGGTITMTDEFAVTLNDQNQAIVPNVAFPNTSGAGSVASVACSAGLGFPSNAVVSGSGLLNSGVNNSVVVAGTIDPGAAAAPGVITLLGDGLFNASGSAEFDIFPSGHDVLASFVLTTFSVPDLITTAHPSDITLGGTLVVRVDPSHTPVSGERRRLIAPGARAIPPVSFSRVLGAFEAMELPPKWLVRISNTGPAFERGLFVIYCPADFNSDGNLDPDDLGDFINCFFTQPPCDGADFNADGNVDPDDLGDFINAFFGGCE